MSELDDLIAKGLIEAVESDRLMAEQWIGDARRHLEAAEAIQTIDPSGAYVLAYDAARKAVAAALLMTGHRVRSRPGSHQALGQYAKVLARETGEPALENLTAFAGRGTDLSTGLGGSARLKSMRPSGRPEQSSRRAHDVPRLTTESDVKRDRETGRVASKRPSLLTIWTVGLTESNEANGINMPWISQVFDRAGYPALNRREGSGE